MKVNNEKIIPEPQEIEEARNNPGGWVYRIAGYFDPTETVPPEAIVGAWKVDKYGKIMNDFIPNPKFIIENQSPNKAQ